VESRYDVVSVYDGATSASRLLLAASNNYTTHPVLPPSVVSSTNEMLVVFTTNEAVQLQGFRASYVSVCSESSLDLIKCESANESYLLPFTNDSASC
jgi:hypothetical protein